MTTSALPSTAGPDIPGSDVGGSATSGTDATGPDTAGMHTVHIRASGLSFPCSDAQTVLEAAETAGLRIPYSCRKGVCATCEGGLSRGSADVRGRGTVTGPTTAVRLCQTRPRGDLDVVPARVERRGPPERKRLAARVFGLEHPAPDVTLLKLRFPIGRRAPFAAGQYLRVLLPGTDGDSRNFSMANAPQDNDGAELHVRHVPGGRFSEEVLGRLRREDTLDVELPFGEFGTPPSADDTPVRPVLLVATGTGFAPIQSIVLDHIRRRLARPLHIYWGARTPADLYRLDAVTAWAGRHPWLRVTPVLSKAAPDWTGRTGLVHRAVLDDHPDLSDHEVLTCGNPAMTTAARDEFTGAGGLPPVQYLSDAFLPSGDA